MKSTLEFNLPEEKAELQLALDAGKFQSIIYHIDEYLRKLEKYDGDKVVIIEGLRAFIAGLCEQHKVDIL